MYRVYGTLVIISTGIHVIHNPRLSLFLRKMSCLGWDTNEPTTLYTLDRALYHHVYMHTVLAVSEITVVLSI